MRVGAYLHSGFVRYQPGRGHRDVGRHDVPRIADTTRGQRVALGRTSEPHRDRRPIDLRVELLAHRRGKRPAGDVVLEHASQQSPQRGEPRPGRGVVRVDDAVAPALKERTPEQRLWQAVVRLARAQMIVPAAVDEIKARSRGPVSGESRRQSLYECNRFRMLRLLQPVAFWLQRSRSGCWAPALRRRLPPQLRKPRTGQWSPASGWGRPLVRSRSAASGPSWPT